MKRLRKIFYKIFRIEHCMVCGHKKSDHWSNKILVIEKDKEYLRTSHGHCLKEGCDCKKFIKDEEQMKRWRAILIDLGLEGEM